MKNAIFALAVALLLATATFAQTETKPWTEWTKKDTEKILNDSAWGQTQVIGGSQSTDTSAVTKTQGAGRESIDRAGESGELIAQKPLNFRVRFLTAKPVREAFARMVVLSRTDAGKDLVDQLQGFIDRDFGNYLVVTISPESADPRMANGSMMALSKVDKESLRDKAYLERKDGKRLALIDYKPPIADNMGAKFIFERTLDGQPFLTSESEFVRFVAEISEKMKVNLRFKVAAMTYGGKLEY